MKMMINLLLIIYALLFVRFSGVCKRRESLWIFILTALVLIPFNVQTIMSLITFVEAHTKIRWFIKAAICMFSYIVLFSIEEILGGVIGRMIWKRQFAIRWK